MEQNSKNYYNQSFLWIRMCNTSKMLTHAFIFSCFFRLAALELSEWCSCLCAVCFIQWGELYGINENLQCGQMVWTVPSGRCLRTDKGVRGAPEPRGGPWIRMCDGGHGYTVCPPAHYNSLTERMLQPLSALSHSLTRSQETQHINGWPRDGDGTCLGRTMIPAVSALCVPSECHHRPWHV